MKSHIPRALSARDRREQAAQKQIISIAMDAFMLISMLALNDTFGFGADRLHRYVAAWHKTAEQYADRYDDAVLVALKRKLHDATGVEMDFK